MHLVITEDKFWQLTGNFFQSSPYPGRKSGYKTVMLLSRACAERLLTLASMAQILAPPVISLFQTETGKDR